MELSRFLGSTTTNLKMSDLTEKMIQDMPVKHLRRLIDYMSINYPHLLDEAMDELGIDCTGEANTEEEHSMVEPEEDYNDNLNTDHKQTVAVAKVPAPAPVPVPVPEPVPEPEQYSKPEIEPEPKYILEANSEPEPKVEPKPEPVPLQVTPKSETIAPDTDREFSPEKGCYLIYDPSSNGRLMIYYSKTYVPGAVGFWAPGPTHSIQKFKFTRNLGRSELIGNCAAGVAGRKNYYSGWCQFIRAAKALRGYVIIFPRNDTQGLDVDIFVYYQSNCEVDGKQTVQIKENVPFDISNVAAVACLPQKTILFDGVAKIELSHWMTMSSKVGASTAFEDSESAADVALMAHLLKGKNYEPSIYDKAAFEKASPKKAPPVRNHSPLRQVTSIDSLGSSSTSSSMQRSQVSVPMTSLNITDEAGCYLVYNTDGAKLILHYSKTAVPDALGFWQPGAGKKIQGFKFKQNSGRSDLQTNCASGVTGRKNYYSGLCQFIRAAKVLDGTVYFFQKGDKPGLEVDIYVYYEKPKEGYPQTFKVEEDSRFYTGGINAVTCLPKHADFFEDNVHIDLNHWMTKASTVGAASRFEYLSC